MTVVEVFISAVGTKALEIFSGAGDAETTNLYGQRAKFLNSDFLEVVYFICGKINLNCA